MMLLVVVSDLDLGAQSEGAFVGGGHLIQYLEQRRLSCSVISDHRHMFSTLDLKADILKQSLVTEAL